MSEPVDLTEAMAAASQAIHEAGYHPEAAWAPDVIQLAAVAIPAAAEAIERAVRDRIAANIEEQFKTPPDGYGVSDYEIGRRAGGNQAARIARGDR
jgi:hypothetical protein